MNKTNKTEHTPEPWETSVITDVWWYVCAPDSGGMIADLSDTEFESCQDEANAKRIVACVNACHDIEDPDRAHAVARDAIREAHVLLESLLGEVPYRTIRPLVIKRLEHLSEAHALLGGGPL